MSAARCRFQRADDGGHWITCPYFDQDFVDALKRGLPRYGRKWNDDRKAWWIAHSALGAAQRIAEKFYGSPEPPRTQATQVPGMEYYSALHLLPSAPAAVVHASYRALSLLHHPDVGGDSRVQTKINLAYATLKKQLAGPTMGACR